MNTAHEFYKKCMIDIYIDKYDLTKPVGHLMTNLFVLLPTRYSTLFLCIHPCYDFYIMLNIRCILPCSMEKTYVELLEGK